MKICIIDIMNNKWIIVLLIIICAAICFVYMTTPTLELDNVHSKKYVETTEYTYSGDVKKMYYIIYGYDITQNKAIDLTMNMNLRLYDKNGNLLDERSFTSVDAEIHEQYEYAIGVTPDIFKKVDKIELTFYKQWEDTELYNITTKVLKGEDELREIDDTPSKTSHNTGRSYPTESMYNPPEEKNYVVISRPGEPELRDYFYEYVPKWGE